MTVPTSRQTYKDLIWTWNTKFGTGLEMTEEFIAKGQDHWNNDFPSSDPLCFCLSLFQWSFLMVVFVSTVKEPTPSSMNDFPPTPDTKKLPRLPWMWVFGALFLLVLLCFCCCVLSPHGSTVCTNSDMYVQSCSSCFCGSKQSVFLCFRNLPMRPCARCACATRTSVRTSTQPGQGNTKTPRWPWWTETQPSTACMRRSRATSWWEETKKRFHASTGDGHVFSFNICYE